MAAPAFRRLWLAGVVSDTGDWFLFVALPLVVLRLSGSAAGASLAFVLELAPTVVLAPVAARLAVRFDRRLLMVCTNLGQALALVPLVFVHEASQLPIVYVVIAAHASLAALFEPAKNSLLPALVDEDQLVSANGLVGLGQNLGRLVGGPLGGVALAAGGLPLVAAVDAASFVVSAVLIASLPRGAGRRIAPAPEAETDATPGVLAAFRLLPLRPVFLIVSLASVAQGMFLVLFLLFVTGPLEGTAADVGVLRGVQAVGAILAGLALGFLARGATPRALTVGSVLAFGLLSLITWNLPRLTTELWPYVVLFAVVGAPGVVMMTGVVSVLQTSAPARSLPAAFAALGLIAAVGQAAGILIAGLAGIPGLLQPLLDVQAALYLCTGVVGLVWLRRPAPAKTALSRP
ncbi:hypothetical protein LK09_06285 [Microbacterium mangrovi]|uniref:Major facilitator superfamily (MFS) profile domain-containing protein n=1 Tax=Microbacterium mangrovi TaxID=1348253 RepID=A0A0B2ABN6_9MICO|nr:hypothetical protein LK09_06285 [Microbacterium mangrovi]